VALSNAANYATHKGDQIQFAETMATRLEAIADVFNADPDFMLAGYTLQVNKDQLPALADDTLKNAQAFNSLVAGGLPVDVAAEYVGIDLPDDFEIETPVPEMPKLPEPEEGGQEDGIKAIELDRLHRFVKNGTHFQRPFTSDVLTRTEIRDVIEQYAYDFDGKTYRP
jgi:hypothetical protein